jgi:hypothetical protein
MTKEIFTAKPYLNNTISAFIALASFIFWLTTYRGFIYIKFIPTPFNELSGYFLAFLGIILTYIIWVLPLQESEDIPNLPKERLVFDSITFKDDVTILKIIKERAPHANFDETTSLILNNQLDMRAVRPFFWWLAIITI